MRVSVQEHREEALDEMLRGEGRGSPQFYEKCARCEAPDPLFRCSRQTCIGPAMYCEGCIAEVHSQLPTHMLEVIINFLFFFGSLPRKIEMGKWFLRTIDAGRAQPEAPTAGTRARFILPQSEQGPQGLRDHRHFGHSHRQAKLLWM
jgi:hypothetical protein